jgi:hypothetical protein
MVFCRQCQRRVEDCVHCMWPIRAPRVRVYDEKVEALAYAADSRTLEVHFRSGQVWQLFNVPDGIYKELKDSTISSFLKFIARRYSAAPVKQGFHAVPVPESEPCPKCGGRMTLKNKTRSMFKNLASVAWECAACKETHSRIYEARNTEHG